MTLADPPKPAKLETLPIPSNEALLEGRRKHFVATAVHYYKEPIHPVRAKGCYVYDEQDREYLDCIGGIVCISAGHNHPKITQRMIGMLQNDEIQHTSTLYLNRYATELAEKLANEAPDGLDKVAFTNSGSEANELAFMAARHATGETMIMNLRHGYHGGTSGVLAACGHHTWRFRAQPVTGMTSAEAPYCYRCPFGKTSDNCALECAKQVESTIQTTTHGKLAAFIAEPVMGVGGFIAPPVEYFHKVAEIVHNYGGKYISDEVQTGAGRCGNTFLLTKDLGIDADMITMAKGFGNGGAAGAVVMKNDISDALAGKMYFNTFAGDPYQAMQALTTMEVIEEEGMIAHAQEMSEYLLRGLNDLMSRHALIGDIRGRGLLLGMELVKDRQTKEYAVQEANQLMELTKERGLLIGKGGLFGNVIRLAPPLTITKVQIDFLLRVLDESLGIIEKQA